MWDPWVEFSQTWLNTTYASVSGYEPVEEDGQTSWSMMFALTRALQHELGISNLSDNFGSLTLSELESQVGDVDSSTANTNVVAIVQCALWCKGYWGGSILGDFSTITELDDMLGDMGFAPSAALPPKAFKSLLTMDAYVLVGSGISEVRDIQRWLNANYIHRDDYFVVPCDGIFSRDVQTGLIFAIQYEIGMIDGVANGYFGPGTRQGVRDYGGVGLGDADGIRAMVSLFQAALIFNAYTVPFDGYFGATTQSQTLAFQGFAELPMSGWADFASWASLLVSTGDPNRSTTGSDTSTPLTAATAAELYAEGYRAVGRYLTVASKRYQPGELETIFDAGLKTFPIFQNYNDGPEYFSYEIGYDEGFAAVRRARQLGFREQNTIYFAVDYDATGEEIDALIVPYFEGVVAGVRTSRVYYRVGVYGTRNVCTHLIDAGLTVSSFVSGMSTGYSGNLGFALPVDWAYDQIATLTIGAGASELEIDKDVSSVRADPAQASDVAPSPLIDLGGGAYGFDESLFWRIVALVHDAESIAGVLVPNRTIDDIVIQYLQEPTYWDASWQAYTPYPELLLPIGPGRSAIESARAAFGGGVHVFPDDANYDIQHFAASLRGYMTWNWLDDWNLLLQKAAIGDLGAWGLDLVTCWEDYEEARLNGYTAGAYAWHVARIGNVSELGQFGRRDLIADVDAFLVFLRMHTMSFQDAVREVWHLSQQDPTWRYTEFIASRFGVTSNIPAAVGELFTSWATQAPINAFVSGRLPGESTGAPSDPSAFIRYMELSEVAQAFVDVLVSLS